METDGAPLTSPYAPQYLRCEEVRATACGDMQCHLIYLLDFEWDLECASKTEHRGFKYYKLYYVMIGAMLRCWFNLRLDGRNRLCSIILLASQH